MKIGDFMKAIKKILFGIVAVIFMISQNVFAATAHLEGETEEETKSFLDGLDSATIMANWYKIIIIAVCVLCVIGIITSNIIWLVKIKKNKKQ
jgi:hypothetical protein